MRNPIRLPSCGHWYCRECVEGLRQAASAQDVCPVCRAALPPGPEKLFDEALIKYRRVERKVERLRRNWSNLPRSLRREMDEVRELYEQAADQGHAVAMNNLGVIYANGHGVAQSMTKALDWAERAAAGGYARAQAALGSYYLLGREGVAIDLPRARMWYEKAAAQGQADAQNDLGAMCCDGRGGPQDVTRARELYELAAAQGHANALNNLGCMLRDGKAGPQDVTRARQLFDLAAAQGHADAMGSIGALYANAQGVQQDLNEAMRWFSKAKAHGANESERMAVVREEQKRRIAHGSRIPAPAPGAEMEVTGLVDRPELNGVRGRMVGHIPGKDRWLVKLNDGHGPVVLKAANLRELTRTELSVKPLT